MTTEKNNETCRCPNRPRFPSWGRDSAAETSAMRRWDAEHGSHAYAKARDTLAQALQAAESSVRVEEQENAGEAVLDMVADVYRMRRRSDGPDPDVAYEGRVFKWVGYQAMMKPEAMSHMVNAVDNILRDCAAYNTPEETARFNALRLEMFRIFPEQKEGYISDPVSAILSRDATGALAPPPADVAAVASEMKAAHDANGSPTDDAP